MGSSKKRKEKARDFAKAKLKLGKGKQLAANATNTSFSSRSIALGQQSIGKEHQEGVATTKRNLSLDDLQNHLKHYSAGTRKDALVGLRELLTTYPRVAYSSIGTVLPLLARTIGDEETSVRKALLGFLAWYLPALPPIILQPYHSVLIFFTTSALSHIYPEVRLDAVRVLNLLLDVCPESMTLSWTSAGQAGAYASTSANEQNHSQRVLECYLALLHVRSGVTTNGLRTDMSPATKALVLGSVAKFLRLSLAPDGSSTPEEMEELALPSVPTWFLRSAFATQRDFDAFVARHDVDRNEHTIHREWDTQLRTFPTEGYTLASTSFVEDGGMLSLASFADISADLSASSDVKGKGRTEGLPMNPEDLLSTLLPILVSAFLDTAPSAFSPSANLTSTSSSSSSAASSSADLPLDTVYAVTEIARDLWRAILSNHSQSTSETAIIPSDLRKGMEKIVGHMGAYFPFGSDELGKRSGSQETKLQNLNIAYCELVALLYLASSGSAKSKGKNSLNPDGSRKKYKSEPIAATSKITNQLASVQKYVETLLAGSSAPLGGNSLNPHSYVELLPTIWSLLLAGGYEETGVMETIVRHSMGLSASSGVKKMATGFLTRVFQMQDSPAYIGAFSLRVLARRPEIRSLLDEWLLSLPRYLWELGANDSDTSRLIIDHLQTSLVFSELSSAVQEKVCAFLSPYFFSQHSTRGEIPGPFTRLRSQDLQKRAVEMGWWFVKDASTGSAKLEENIGKAVRYTKDQDLVDMWTRLQLSLS